MLIHNPFLKLFLLPFLYVGMWLYRAGLFLDRAMKERSKVTLARPVISVGNLTWGGTGKTPVLIKLVADLKEMGLKPAILTRGFGGGATSTEIGSDEVQLMLAKCPGVPMGVGANRIEKAEELLKANPLDVFLLDDGFQHWKINRALDIVCIDAASPWGGDRLIPLGTLREPKNNLARAHIILLTRSELTTIPSREALRDAVQTLAPSATVLCTEFKSTLMDWDGRLVNAPSLLYGQMALTLSAIGNPGSFEERVARWGASILSVRYRDHHVYTEADLHDIKLKMTRTEAILVTTEKDWMKLKRTSWTDPAKRPKNLFIVKIETAFLGKDQGRWMDILKSIIPAQ